MPVSCQDRLHASYILCRMPEVWNNLAGLVMDIQQSVVMNSNLLCRGINYYTNTVCGRIEKTSFLPAFPFQQYVLKGI